MRRALSPLVMQSPLAAEALLERHGVEISRETLHKWMVGDGLWLSRKQRRSFRYDASRTAS
nr:hypothetical protein [Edaphobacter aggregans]